MINDLMTYHYTNTIKILGIGVKLVKIKYNFFLFIYNFFL